MGEDRKKQVMIGVIVACILLAAGITYWRKRGSSSSATGSNRPIYMLCVNPDCNKDFEITTKESREMMQAKGPEGMDHMMGPMMPGQIAFKCKFCGEESAYRAEKCEKCGLVFIPDYATAKDYPDRCPECGYSRLEEIRKERSGKK